MTKAVLLAALYAVVTSYYCIQLHHYVKDALLHISKYLNGY